MFQIFLSIQSKYEMPPGLAGPSTCQMRGFLHKNIGKEPQTNKTFCLLVFLTEILS